MLAEVGTIGERVAPELRALAGDKSLAPLAGYLREVAFLARTAGTIRTAIGAIRRIVGALKSYSRLDEAPLERVDVHAGIEDTLVILSHQLKYGENGVNVKRSFGSLPPISAYVGELNQVWTNLIHNAMQAMDGRGEILIETKVGERGRGGRRSRTAGPGSRPTSRRASSSRSSPPRRRARGPGSGSHLRAHRREARRDDPRRQPARAHALRGPPAGRRAEPARAGGTAAVQWASARLMPQQAPDARTARARAHRLRRRRGGHPRGAAPAASARFGDECDIAVAKNAREALELIDDLQQDGEQLAVVIADQIMPGMKGVELLEEVHRRCPQTMKILLTGQAGLDAVVDAINSAGLDQYIPKPWDEPDLRLTVESLLSRFRLERERAELLASCRTQERRAGDAELVARGEGRRAHPRARGRRTRASPSSRSPTGSPASTTTATSASGCRSRWSAATAPGCRCRCS